MCSIAGLFSLTEQSVAKARKVLKVMNDLQAHRGPDGEGVWLHANGHVGLAHRRLSIIDLETGHQPMSDNGGNWISFNGEIYNYKSLRSELGGSYRTNSDTEVILRAYRKWGFDCVNHLTGMFAFAIWDEQKQLLFCARDRFGISPFCYTVQNNVFYFASEYKALLPMLPAIRTDTDALKDYLTFQFCLDSKTLFQGIQEIKPAHTLVIKNGKIIQSQYWQVYYDLDWNHTEHYFLEKLDYLLTESVRRHIVSDVPVGGYVSGGIDSSSIAGIASQMVPDFMGFTGKFDLGPDYDESMYAQDVADLYHFPLHQLVITAQDFMENIEKIMYHMDMPAAGPGSFNQYMVSQFSAQYRKVLLGGQGGDEIFGGYIRYLIAYFEQCIKGAIDGTMNAGNFIVTYESIIPNLKSLRNYKPMLQDFWKEGLFDEPDKRYYRLVNRNPDMLTCVNWALLGDYSPYETFREIFCADNVKKASYFDSMIHFDFKTSLPALLHVEDRMSKAHSIESRVPFLDHELVEFVATIPANFKLKDGDMKHILKKCMAKYLPQSIQNRKDKMGFPTPFASWIKNEAKAYVHDILTTREAQSRDIIDNKKVLEAIEKETKFGRNIWGFLCLELWQRQFHDREAYYHSLIK